MAELSARDKRCDWIAFLLFPSSLARRYWKGLESALGILFPNVFGGVLVGVGSGSEMIFFPSR